MSGRSRMRGGISRAVVLAAAAFLVFGAELPTSVGQILYKASNNDNFEQASSWEFPEGAGDYNGPPVTFNSTRWFGSGMGESKTVTLSGNIQVGAIRVDNTVGTPNYGATIKADPASSTITLNGNSHLGGSGLVGIVLNDAVGGSLTVETGIAVRSNQSWVSSRDYTIDGAISLEGNLLTFRQSGGSAFINGAISGTGGIVTNFGGSVTSLTGGNSYQGTTRVVQGVLQVSGGGTLGGTAGSTNDSGNIVFSGTDSNGTLRFSTAANLGVASQIRFGNTGGTAGSGGRLEYVGTTDQTISKTIQSDSIIGMRIASNSVGGSLTVNGPFSQSNRSLYLEGTGTGNNTMAAVFSGTGVLHKRESGTWLVSSSNDYSGGTVISGGVLRVNALSGIGSGSLTIQDGSTFRYEGAVGETTSRALNLNSGASTIDVTNSDASLTFSSTDGVRNQAFTKAGSGELTIAGGFSGAASITVAGGTLRLTGASDHSGTTTVNDGGALVIDGTHTGGGDYDIQTGGELMGTGTIGANVSVANGATLAAGNSIGTLNIVGNLTVGGAFEWEVNSALNSADLVNVNGHVNLTGATLDIVQLVDFPAGQKFTLLSYSGTLTGSFSGFDTAMWTINYADGAAGLNGGSHANFVTLSAVPEPTAFLFVGATIAVGFLRRRRSV